MEVTFGGYLMAGLRWSPHREISKPARLAQGSAARPPPDDPAPINLPAPSDTALLMLTHLDACLQLCKFVLVLY